MIPKQEMTDNKDDSLSSSSLLLPPYSMCSLDEYRQRSAINEVSLWERSADDQTPDPRRMVKKYRRSVGQQDAPRSLQQLKQTVDYLTKEIIVHRRTASGKELPFLDAVAFVEDRIRAVQKDMTMLQQYDSQLCLKMIKFHVLVLHLLSDTREYVSRFGHSALQGAFAGYWYSSQRRLQDDVLVLCLQFIQVQKASIFHSESVWGDSVQSLYRKYTDTVSPELTRTLIEHEFFSWTLRLVGDLERGFWRNALNCLSTREDLFGALARMVLSPVLPKIFWNALEACNTSFQKSHRVQLDELCRFLYGKASKEHICALHEFCQDTGLLVDDGKVVFKEEKMLKFPCEMSNVRWNDLFVLPGCKFDSDRNGMRIPDREYMLSLFA